MNAKFLKFMKKLMLLNQLLTLFRRLLHLLPINHMFLIFWHPICAMLRPLCHREKLLEVNNVEKALAFYL